MSGLTTEQKERYIDFIQSKSDYMLIQELEYKYYLYMEASPKTEMKRLDYVLIAEQELMKRLKKENRNAD